MLSAAADLAATLVNDLPPNVRAVVEAHFFDVDASFAKNVHLTERFKLQLRADAANLTNHPSFDIPTASAVITNTTFGRIRGTTASVSRKVQLGVKLTF